MEQALDLLPDNDDLLPLRGALIGASRADRERAWSDAELYLMLGTRLLDADALEATLPQVVERERDRVAGVYARVVAALRAAAAGDHAAAARAMVAAGEVEEAAGRLDAAEAFYRRAAELGRKPRDRSGEGLALRRLGRVARARGQLDRALGLYERGFQIASALEDREGAVVACQGLGNVCADQGRWEEAERWYALGLERLGEQGPTRERWQLESNLSVVARRAGRVDRSEEWLRRARSTVEALGDAAGRVYVCNAEGLLLVSRGRVAEAEASYREALEVAGSPAERATVLVNLADALLVQGRAAHAERALRELEGLALAHRLVGFLPHAYRGLGGVARLRRDEDGFVFFEQALALCLEEGLPALELALTHEEYAAFELALGRAEPAAARLREAHRIFRDLGTRPELERVETRLRELDPTGGAGPEPRENSKESDE